MKAIIVGATLNKTQLVLYTTLGKTIVLNQGDERIQPVLDLITEPLERGEAVEVDLTKDNIYSSFEKKSGLVKFFRVAKQAVTNFFGSNEPKQLGNTEAVLSKQHDVSEIMKHAIPAKEEHFNTPTDDTTVIAIMGDDVIDGVENLERQFANAYRLGSTEGVENFLKRLGKVIKKRRHSVEDLLKFMERGDLPIADDGCIVIYKALNRKDSNGLYVDSHSGNVRQKVGSYVFMAESLVDPDRGQDCSNGLHVARRGYLSNFRCNVCVIAKVKPEDVIAVPEYDANKMRVCGYHILYELPDDLYHKLLADKPMTDTEAGRKILGAVLSGNHIGVTQTVEITGNRGTGLKINDLETVTEEVTTTNSSFEAEAINLDAKTEETAPVIDPKKIIQKMNSRQAEAKTLFDKLEAQTTKVGTIVAFNALHDFKRVKKVSWEKLGLDSAKIKEYELFIENSTSV